MQGRPPDPLAELRAALDVLVHDGADILGLDAHEDLRNHARRVEQRLAHSEATTVAALAGGTGVGKSALANQLAGEDVVTEGVRRPTTDHPVLIAARLDPEVTALADWLGIEDRREATGVPAHLALVDLPDLDSVVHAHGEMAARLTDRVDALVLVVDPLKYARADLYRDLLADLRRHEAVLTVVLNRSDEVADPAVLLADLRRHLAEAGVRAADVLATSAATGAGTADLRARLTDLAADRRAAATRLVADAGTLAAALNLPDPPSSEVPSEPVVQALLATTDAARVLASAPRQYRRQAHAAVRSPLARAARRPFTQLAYLARGLGVAPKSGTRHDRSTAVLQQTRPEVAAAAVSAGLASAAGLAQTRGRTHEALAAMIEHGATQAAPALAREVDATTARSGAPRRWWRVAAGARTVTEATVATGAIWLTVLAVLAWLRLPAPAPPVVLGGLTLPTLLVLGGAGARVALGVATRSAIRAGAARVHRTVAAALGERLEVVVTRDLMEPYRAEVARLRALQQARERLLRAAPERTGPAQVR